MDSTLGLLSIFTGLLRLWLRLLTLTDLSTLILWPILERLDSFLPELLPLAWTLLLETLDKVLVVPDLGEEL